MSLLDTFVTKAYAADVFHIPTPNGPPSSLDQLATRILGVLVSLSFPLAFIALLYTAYILITSAGKPEAWTTAKKNILYLAIGIFLIVFAALMVNFVIGLFS